MATNEFEFPCKTLGCNAWLLAGEIDDNLVHIKHIPHAIGRNPDLLYCPVCGQTHDYYFSDREVRPEVGSETA
jgi:hypothetical protein